MDTGTGMPKAILAQIFTPFTLLDQMEMDSDWHSVAKHWRYLVLTLAQIQSKVNLLNSQSVFQM
jgi:hypothetical protein